METLSVACEKYLLGISDPDQLAQQQSDHGPSWPLIEWMVTVEYAEEQRILCSITKTRLFKYVENFTRKENFQIKILIFFIFLLKTQIVGTR